MSIPLKLKIDNIIYNMIDIELPHKNYLILKTFISKNTKKTNFLYIIEMKGRNSLKVGRATDMDVLVSDISVSRIHGEIKLINGSFYINDCNSKFGILVSVGYDYIVIPNKIVSIQIRKHFFSFQLKKTICSTLSCYK